MPDGSLNLVRMPSDPIEYQIISQDPKSPKSDFSKERPEQANILETSGRLGRENCLFPSEAGPLVMLSGKEANKVGDKFPGLPSRLIDPESMNDRLLHA
jgi:hypothetical protein